MIDLKSFSYKWTNSELYYLNKDLQDEDESPRDKTKENTVLQISNFLWDFW